jgi:uncharacterized DUF497 family protein
MRFEWDPRKAASNLTKHGVSFLEACTVFDDPFALRALDERHSTSLETREWLIGQSDSKVLVVVFTVRYGWNAYRIISARKATRKERLTYENSKRIPL